jgi:hypothetical protein
MQVCRRSQAADDVKENDVSEAEYIDPETGEVVEVPPNTAPGETAIVPATTDALTQFGQDDIGIERAKRVANELDAIIQEKGLSVSIGQGDHLRVEAWCACASLVGLSPRTAWTKRVPEVGELEGYIARVEVVQIATGQVVGAAEAGCFNDEQMGGRPRWKDQHAVMSMAQTRATSKGIGQILRWIPVLAGYSGTPAEEMPRGAPAEMPPNEAQPYVPVPPKPKPQQPIADPKRTVASEKQLKMLYAVSMERAEQLLDACIDEERAAGLDCEACGHFGWCRQAGLCRRDRHAGEGNQGCEH